MFAFTYAQVFAATDISAEVVFILPSLRKGQPLFGGVEGELPSLSSLQSILRITYTIDGLEFHQTNM